MKVEGGYSLQISIDGKPLQVLRPSFRALSIVESAIDLLPTMSLRLLASRSDPEYRPAREGALIEISITSEREPDSGQDIMIFRHFSSRIISSEQTDYLEINGYLNAPDYFNHAGFDFYDSSSTEVARSIAELSGLDFDGDPASDSQVWIRGGLTGGGFLRDVTKHAYANDQSAFVTCVTRDGELRFYDLGSRKKNTPIWEFKEVGDVNIPTDANQVVISDSLHQNRSGFLNRLMGYGAFGGEFSTITGNLEEVFINEIDKSTSHLSISEELQIPTRFDSGSFNVGNTHDNFYKAKIQNAQILSTFSDGHITITSRPKAVRLLDRVRYQSNKTDDPTQIMINGEYFVDRISTLILPEALMTKYFLTREGINSVETEGLL